MEAGALYQKIVPPEVRQRFEQGARGNSDFLWDIGDTALELYEKFSEKKQKGVEHFGYVTDAQFWTALGYYCGKSGPRVKRIADVSKAFYFLLRSQIEEDFGYWDFGYHEHVCGYSVEKIVQIFEFLAGCRDGELLYPGRRLGVGEFLFIYEQHIEGLIKEDREPECEGLDLWYAPVEYRRPLPFQDILGAGRRLRMGLVAHLGKPAVQKFVGLLDEILRLAPEVMRETGIEVPIDKREEVPVE